MNKTNKLYWIYLIGFFLILTLPLFSGSFTSMFYPPPWGKTIIFRIIFSVLIFLFTYQILLKKGNNTIKSIAPYFLDKKNKAFWPIWFLTALFGIYLLATIFSLEPHFSFWGSPDRAGGFLNYAFYIIFAVLIFLILRARDWQKIMDFTLFIGVLVSLIAICQKFALFKEFLTPYFYYSYRPASTMGNPLFLALYLTLLIFISFSFAISAKNKKRYLYLFYSALFLFVSTLTATRSALLGIFIGFLFFIFFFPVNQENSKKTIKYLKILTLIILISGVLGVFWLKTQPQFVQNLKENKTIGISFERIWANTGEFSFKSIFISRGDGWKVAVQGIKDRPLLGYGPENFSIAFDKYYDPALSGIAKTSSDLYTTGWWDRAHNFMLDISSSAGIPALIIYLLFFGTLFWQLQKIKNNTNNPNNSYNIKAHGIQTAFISYLTAVFFSFDTFSTYLILFLIIGYSLHLISSKRFEIETNPTKAKLWKYILLFILFFSLSFFVWNYNLKPLYANKEANKAYTLTLLKDKECDKAIKQIEEVLIQQTIIDNNLRFRYVDIIGRCIKYNPKKYKLNLSQRAVEILEESMESRPSFTRNWQYAGNFITKMLEANKSLEIKAKEKLSEKAFSYFEKALELSPKRQDIYKDMARLNISLDNLEKAEKNIKQCVILNTEFGDCWWTKAMLQIQLEKDDEAKKTIKIASEKGYLINSKKAITDLVYIYSKMAQKTNDLKYSRYLAELYPKLIKNDFEYFQYHASLAFVYKKLGEYDKARKQAMIVLKLSPESKQSVEEFLKTLP